MNSAWCLLQHVQHSHGVKIYLEDNTVSKRNSNDQSSISSLSASSSLSSSNSSSGQNQLHHQQQYAVSAASAAALRHLIPPHDLHNPFAVNNLLRLPLPPPTPMFSRPDHFRMDQFMSEQFRNHGLNLAAAAAVVTANAISQNSGYSRNSDRVINNSGKCLLKF